MAETFDAKETAKYLYEHGHIMQHEHYKTISNEIDTLRRQRDMLRELLKAANCPCCDGSGAFYDNYGNVCQCQWCDEVKAALAEEDK